MKKLLVAMLLVLAACSDDNKPDPALQFSVIVENVKAEGVAIDEKHVESEKRQTENIIVLSE